MSLTADLKLAWWIHDHLVFLHNFYTNRNKFINLVIFLNSTVKDTSVSMKKAEVSIVLFYAFFFF